MSSGEPLRFSYRLSFARTVAMLLVGFAVPCGLAYIATANERPVHMFGLITLSRAQAATFFWTFAAVTLLAACITLWVVIRNRLGPQHVELGTTAAFVPRASLSRTMLSVPYAAIQRIRTVQVPGQQMIIIDSSVGQSSLMSKAFATPADFTRFLHTLQERTRG